MRDPTDRNKLLAHDTLTPEKRHDFVRALSDVAAPGHTVLLLFCDICEYNDWVRYAFSIHL